MQALKQPASGQIAHQGASAKGGYRQRHNQGRNPGHLKQGYRQVAEHAEHAGKANGADAQRIPHLNTAKGLQLGQWVAAHHTPIQRQKQRDQQHREQRNHGHRNKGVAPVNLLPEQGRQRVAHQDRQCQAQHHQADRRRALVRRHQRGRHQRRHTKVGAVRQAGDKARQ